jgi:hypothetical protein
MLFVKKHVLRQEYIKRLKITLGICSHRRAPLWNKIGLTCPDNSVCSWKLFEIEKAKKTEGSVSEVAGVHAGFPSLAPKEGTDGQERHTKH